MIFFIEGTYKVGYSLNNKQIFVIPYKSNQIGNAIGAYGVTFNRRSKFLYKTVTDCKGQFIRKKYWQLVLNEIDADLCKSIKIQIRKDHIYKVFDKILAHKKL